MTVGRVSLSSAPQGGSQLAVGETADATAPRLRAPPGERLGTAKYAEGLAPRRGSPAWADGASEIGTLAEEPCRQVNLAAGVLL